MAYDPAKDQRRNDTKFDATTQARKAAAIIPHDSNDLSIYAKALYIGVGGDVALIPVASDDDTPVVFKNCAQASILPVQARRVRATATTATNIVALYD